MVSTKSRWKIVRALALGIVAFGLTASSQVSKVNACISCGQVCTGSLCQSVCSEAGNSGGQNCTTNNGICQVFGSCGGAGGGEGGGIGGIGN